MKKHSGTILLVLIFFVGLAVMLYPTISDYINQRNQTRVVNSYAQQVDGLSDADLENPLKRGNESKTQPIVAVVDDYYNGHLTLGKKPTVYKEYFL